MAPLKRREKTVQDIKISILGLIPPANYPPEKPPSRTTTP